MRGDDDITLGQPSLQPSFEAGSKSQGNGNNTSIASVARSSDNSVEVIEFPSLLDFTAGHPIQSNSNPYRCGRCGSHLRLCPEAMFGVFLTQEMMSVCKRQHGDVTIYKLGTDRVIILDRNGIKQSRVLHNVRYTGDQP